MKRWLSVALVPMFLSACLANNYRVNQDELVRLSQTPPEQRWQAVRVTQSITGGDNPPANTPVQTSPDAPPVYSSGGVYGGGAVVTHVALTASLPPPPGLPHPPSPPIIPSGLHLGGNGTSGLGSLGHLGSGGGGGGGGGEAEAIAYVAIAVGVVAVSVIILAATEGARYDGWIAVNPDEPVYLHARDQIIAVPLSVLTPELAYMADGGGRLYEGPDRRFYRLARAPFDRSGLSLSAGAFGTGIGAPDGALMLAFGIHANASYNILGWVNVGLTARYAGGSTATRSAGLGQFGFEAAVFPIRWAGVYAGLGYAARNYNDETMNRSDGGWYANAGVQGDLPITTRLSLQLRFGGARVDVHDQNAAYTLEGSLGLGIY